MASAMINGAGSVALIRGIKTEGLGFVGSELHGRHFPKMVSDSAARIPTSISKTLSTPRCSLSASRPASQPRFIQHQQEAFWLYRFLSIVYDHIINPGHWTEDMRDEALEPADLNNKNMIVVDVGGGTGFTTLGIIKPA
uniref:MPBQ/MBSQ family SAM-binding methyltransferase profile domain-containing protein n=1 Tax=Kalanchoe fedtschenkoi TaxID=63787 RepID=A0A7N0TII5_KALFE